MNYHKRLVFDFDDTISFSKNRDWKNADPNIPLIEKINKLYNEGWQIDIFTARGSLSCSTRDEAKEKYLGGMEDWLKRNNVKYHSVSFDKPLATYYIDDKSLTPEEFISINIEQLQGGLSGSDIYSDGKSVHKVDKNAHTVRNWYENVLYINVPKIERVVGEVITMEYVKHDPRYFNDNMYVALGLIQDALYKLRKNEVKYSTVYESYLNRIETHVKNSLSIKISNLFYQFKKDFKLNQTFSHGDFGITNMLFKNNSLYLIDPIPDVFGCTEIDAAKFICSLYINKYEQHVIDKSLNSTFSFCTSFNETLSKEDFKFLILCETIRIYKYHPDKSFIENIAERICS